jgi:hypothetical protein
MRDIDRDKHGRFALAVDPFTIDVDDRPTNVYARWLAHDGSPTLHEVTSLEISGPYQVTIHEIPLKHRKIGEVGAAYGDFVAGGKPSAFIATAWRGEERIVVRIRDSKDGPFREESLGPFVRGGTLA